MGGFSVFFIYYYREAVQNCPEDDHFLDDNGLTQEEKQKRVHISQVHMHQIVGLYSLRSSIFFLFNVL